MVGHTGHYAATVAAIEALDACLGRIDAAVRRAGGSSSSRLTTATPSR